VIYMQRVRREIASLEKNGVVTPEQILEFGKKKPGSAVHSYLNDKEVWDKDKAQHNYGVIVCRELLRKIKVVEETEEYVVKINTPQYVRNPDAEGNEQSYINIGHLRKTPDKLRNSLIPYISRALSNLQTATYLSEGTGCTEYLEEAIAFINETIDKIREHEEDE